MNTSRLLLFALCLLPLPLLAQTQTTNVPEIAVQEAERRGNMVQVIGGPVAGDDSQFAAAIAPPADDSHKWYITLITMQGCPACDRLKQDLARAPELKAWVDVADAEKSPTHYQHRKYEDRTQRDWFAGIDQQLRKGGFPAVVIQPPRSGQYGKCATTVAILHGYNGNPADLSERIRRAVSTYVQEYAAKHRAPLQVGIRQAAEPEPAISGPPPFNVLPVPQPANDWPAVINPQPLTLSQIKQLVPDAPPDFLLNVAQQQITDPQQVMLQWTIHQLQVQQSKAPAKDGVLDELGAIRRQCEHLQQDNEQLIAKVEAAPAAAADNWLTRTLALFTGGTTLTVIGLIVQLWRKYQKDAELQAIIKQLLESLKPA